MNRYSELKRKILIQLARNPISNLVELAGLVDSLRPSVSRSIHSLSRDGLVYFNDDKWELTETGWSKVEAIDPVLGLVPINWQWLWSDCSSGFICPCGNEIILSEGGELKNCDCGRIYLMDFSVQVGWAIPRRGER